MVEMAAKARARIMYSSIMLQASRLGSILQGTWNALSFIIALTVFCIVLASDLEPSNPKVP